MKHFVEGVVGIVLAVVLHTVLGKVSAPLLIVFNVFSWVVLYFGLTRHEVFGAVMGTVCGLLQDSLSLGVFGVGGLTKTLLGFGAGYISRKINVTPVTRTFIFALIMSAMEKDRFYEDLSLILSRTHKVSIVIGLLLLFLVFFCWKVQILDHKKYWT